MTNQNKLLKTQNTLLVQGSRFKVQGCRKLAKIITPFNCNIVPKNVLCDKGLIVTQDYISRVARSKKIKKAKFGHKQFQKKPNPEK